MSKEVKWFVTDECIRCKQCAIIAESVFRLPEGKKAEVIRQPKNAAERRECMQAQECCPVHAIHVKKK